MKFSSAAFVLAAAVGASAHPGVEARDFVIAKKPFAPVKPADVAAPSATLPAAPAAPAAPTVAYDAPAAPAAPSTPVPGFCSTSGPSKRATAGQIAYKGNVGGTGGAYGCNMMTVPKSIVDQYQYSATFINNCDQDQVCVCWNKIGRDDGINGCFKGNEALKFALPARKSQSVVFDTNTQGGCACDVGEIAYTAFGQVSSTWVEMDFGNISNDGWSGADASCLVPAHYQLPISALQVCLDDQCSTINEGGSGTNAYVGGTEDADGVGLNIKPGPAHLKVTVG